MNRLDAVCFGLAGLLILTGAKLAFPHDIYMSVKKRGIPCCGGQADTGDCEPLRDEQIQVNADGTVRMYSRRYSAWILVSKELVDWDTIPGDKPEDAGHYCGKPKTGLSGYGTTDEIQADPGFFTYCAFVKPGGV